MTGACHHCGAGVDARGIAVRDVCAGCGAYLHCCRNCEFHEPGVHNDCREPNAEMVADKEQGNFCEYFRLSPAPRGAERSGASRDRGARSVTPSASLAADARRQLGALFRKT